MIFYSLSDTGKIRKDNQDSVYAKALNDSCALFIVADGMGGYQGGKMASSMAVDIISAFVEDKFEVNMKSDEIYELLQDAIRAANAKIYQKSMQDDSLSGMGTTVVTALVSGKTLYTASVGDSREYLFASNRLYQITKDHSLVADLVSRGIITTEEAKNHSQKNVITRAVGTEDTVIADGYITDINNDDIILICSDGLHTMVSDEEISAVLKSNFDDAAAKLIDKANEYGGKDNISVITVKISDEVK